jgi:hypothetical protein
MKMEEWTETTLMRQAILAKMQAEIAKKEVMAQWMETRPPTQMPRPMETETPTVIRTVEEMETAIATQTETMKKKKTRAQMVMRMKKRRTHAEDHAQEDTPSV